MKGEEMAESGVRGAAGKSEKLSDSFRQPPESWEWGIEREGEVDLVRRWYADTVKFDRSITLLFDLVKTLYRNILENESFRTELRYDAEAKWVQVETFRLDRELSRDECDPSRVSQAM